MSMQVIRTSEKENSPKYIYNYIRCKICLVLRFDFLLWVVKKNRKYCCFFWSREVMSRVKTLVRVKLGEGKRAAKTRPVNCFFWRILLFWVQVLKQSKDPLSLGHDFLCSCKRWQSAVWQNHFVQTRVSSSESWKCWIIHVLDLLQS